MADEALLKRALLQANGIDAHARQIYWRERALALQQTDASQLQDLVAQLAVREQRLRSRKESHRWIWAIACVAGCLGAAIFPRFAFRAARNGGADFYSFLFLSLASLGLAIYALVASRYHTHTD